VPDSETKESNEQSRLANKNEIKTDQNTNEKHSLTQNETVRTSF
jgi:hypothetical protein